LAFGQAVCGNAAATSNAPTAGTTPTPSNDGGGETTGSTQDDTNYNDGFAAGWASVTGSNVAPGATVSSGWMSGYADGAAAAAAMPVVAPASGDTAPSTDPTTGSEPTTPEAPTSSSDPTPSNEPTEGGGTPPSSASTPQPDGDGDDGEGSKNYLRNVPTGPGVAGLVTSLAGGKSFLVSGVGQATGGGGVAPGVGPDDRTPSDEGGGDGNEGRHIPLGANISIPVPRDPELDPHAMGGLANAVARVIMGTMG
jgi:hypothetical protein